MMSIQSRQYLLLAQVNFSIRFKRLLCDFNGCMIRFLYQATIQLLCLTRNHVVAYTRYMNWDKDAIFKALGDSTRRLILDELSERNELTLYELTVRLITKHNLSITRQAIAKHLSVLEDAELVKSKRKGKYRVLIFNNEPLKNLLKGWVE